MSKNLYNSLLIIPTFNEQSNLDYINQEISKALKNWLITKVLYIDDCSSDRSNEKIQSYTSETTESVSLLKNWWKGKVFLEGLSYAIANNFDRLFMIDADLIDIPENLFFYLHNSLNEGNIMATMPCYEGSRNRKLPHSTNVSWERGIRIKPFIKILESLKDINIEKQISQSRFGLEVLLHSIVNTVWREKNNIICNIPKNEYPLSKEAYRWKTNNQKRQENEINKIELRIKEHLSVSI